MDHFTPPEAFFREHQQKTFVILSGFWSLRWWGAGLSKSVKKENS